MAERVKRKTGIPCGFLIDIYSENSVDPDHIVNKVKSAYPEIYIGRKDRFYSTVKRIISPTIPSILDGKITLSGDALELYRKKIWIPKIRNTKKIKNVCDSSADENSDTSTESESTDIPGFVLGEALLNSEDTEEISDLDPDLNIPSFVDCRYAPRIVRRRENRTIKKVNSLKKEVKLLKSKVNDYERVISQLQKQILSIKHHEDHALEALQKKYDLSCLDFEKLEAKFEAYVDTHVLSKIETSHSPPHSSAPESLFCLKTKQGKTYSPVVRTLYYTLLASQIPPSKIAIIIKDVLSTFFPGIDATQIKLPAASCAGYMRREELKTVSMAHQATVLCAAEKIHLNSDATTKNQHKLNATAFNGMVISVSEIPDGKADTVIEDIDQQFQKLRQIANQLGISNHDTLNWSMICSSTSDSAATQKRLNDLIEQRKEEDSKVFPNANSESLEIVRNFCAMHLGINLRKAFVAGQTLEYQESIDTFVYEFCKLFGSHGTPEYAVGCVQFKDFLKYKIDEFDCSNELYYTACLNISLSRQVGNRYFVTSHNAIKINFLIKAAADFLTFTNKCDSGNKLEKDVFSKMSDSNLLTLLKADALMFHHIYSDLVVLAKSKELKKSAYDMRQHFLELKIFLEDLMKCPEIISNPYAKVFPSESKLYMHDSKFNHRIHDHDCNLMECTQEYLFQSLPEDKTFLFNVITKGASFMHEKLCSYASDYLPDGIYWEPDTETMTILKALEPSNDLCESILGLNDYLCTSIPNMLQITKSNLTEIKKKIIQ